MTLFALAFTAAGCAAEGEPALDDGADLGASAITQGATVTGMRVVGNQLQKDGAPFLARGFNMIGALTPAWCNQGTGIRARDNFGSLELTTAVNDWHANTIRLQISQRGLEDPTRTQAERDAYLAQVRDDVLLARSFGLVVILSMQDQSIGCGPVHPLPSTQTVAAWQKLAPAFANWGYVMYELFNEPQNSTSSAAWAQWRDGGNTPLANLGDTTVGFQALVAAVRNTGAKNVVIADAALKGEHLDNITPFLLTEQASGRGIAYAIHPYFYKPGAAYWQTSWGFLTPSRAVIATEWNFQADDCGTTVETLAPSFLAFLHDHGIGITAHAFDFLGTLISDFSWTPTRCGSASGGAGQVLKDWYAQLAG
jgi:Cellulase (glycosyl hydrolase family 5)